MAHVTYGPFPVPYPDAKVAVLSEPSGSPAVTYDADDNPTTTLTFSDKGLYLRLLPGDYTLIFRRTVGGPSARTRIHVVEGVAEAEAVIPYDGIGRAQFGGYVRDDSPDTVVQPPDGGGGGGGVGGDGRMPSTAAVLSNASGTVGPWNNVGYRHVSYNSSQSGGTDLRWFTFTAPGSYAHFDTNQSGDSFFYLDTVVLAYNALPSDEGGDTADYYGDENGDNGRSIVTFPTTPGQQYWVAAGPYDSGFDNVNIDLLLAYDLNSSGPVVADGSAPVSPVTDLVATPGINAMSLTWTPPSSAGLGTLVGYHLRAEGSNGNPDVLTDVGIVTSYQFTGLAPGSQYQFHVVAYNDVGQNSSDTAVYATPDGVYPQFENYVFLAGATSTTYDFNLPSARTVVVAVTQTGTADATVAVDGTSATQLDSQQNDLCLTTWHASLAPGDHTLTVSGTEAQPGTASAHVWFVSGDVDSHSVSSVGIGNFGYPAKGYSLTLLCVLYGNDPSALTGAGPTFTQDYAGSVGPYYTEAVHRDSPTSPSFLSVDVPNSHGSKVFAEVELRAYPPP